MSCVWHSVIPRSSREERDYSEGVVECAEVTRQHDPAPASPHTAPIPELAGIKAALGDEAERKAAVERR
jgi:hypothetical protein